MQRFCSKSGIVSAKFPSGTVSGLTPVNAFPISLLLHLAVNLRGTQENLPTAPVYRILGVGYLLQSFPVDGKTTAMIMDHGRRFVFIMTIESVCYQIHCPCRGIGSFRSSIPIIFREGNGERIYIETKTGISSNGSKKNILTRIIRFHLY